ncbi:MAG: hypothetical protein H7328_10365 [Bdellovibrio sp.]|nr:hypothetical protein [Bdellovibrio sp.]
MKFLLTATLIFSCFAANANTVSGENNSVNGTSLSAGAILDTPTGFIQIIEPWLNMGGDTTRSFSGDDISGAAACQIISKSYVGIQTESISGTEPKKLAQFFDNGTLAISKGYLKIGILTCK